MTEFKVTLDLSERLETAINRLCGALGTAPAAEAAESSVTMPAVEAPSVAAVPVAEAPAFSVEQVSRAGADLIAANPAKKPELQALLGRFGVAYVGALKPEQTGAFATALRGLGANI